jgi:hypothetical protein
LIVNTIGWSNKTGGGWPDDLFCPLVAFYIKWEFYGIGGYYGIPEIGHRRPEPEIAYSREPFLVFWCIIE